MPDMKDFLSSRDPKPAGPVAISDRLISGQLSFKHKGQTLALPIAAMIASHRRLISINPQSFCCD